MAPDVYMEPDPEGGYTADPSEAGAVAWLRAHTGGDAASEEYTLDDEDLVRVLRESRIADLLGRPPLADDWIPSWDLNRAASKCWGLIADRLATTTARLGSDAARVPNDCRYRNALRQRDHYDAQRPSCRVLP
jgi:hypothetical protein